MNISKYFQHRFTLSEDGAKTFIKGVIASLFLNLALMLPVIFIFLFITDYLHPVIQAGNSTTHGLWYYVLTALCFMTVLFVIAMIQYKSTYTKIYTESANRRIGIAEKLRKLPLAFFGEKNLSDLTATMMEDCNMLETLFSHTVPQLFASVISIILIATGMFFYNWQLALALFGVVPVATTVIFLGKRLMDKANKEYYHVRRDTTEQIQEGLEAAQEIKSYKSTYTKIYTESANRRIGIAEKLRKLPLAFFGEKNLSDLTATMMEDCNMLETLFSHTVPQLFASVISIILIATGMFFYNWQLALALFGVVPVATTVIFLGKRLMDKANKEYYHVRRDTTEQIQEGLEAAQEIKSYNGEAAYCDRLDKQLEIYEATLQRGEFLGAGLVGSAQSILKLGLASVIIAGAYLLGLGSIDMFTYFSCSL